MFFPLEIFSHILAFATPQVNRALKGASHSLYDLALEALFKQSDLTSLRYQKKLVQKWSSDPSWVKDKIKGHWIKKFINLDLPFAINVHFLKKDELKSISILNLVDYNNLIETILSYDAQEQKVTIRTLMALFPILQRDQISKIFKVALGAITANELDCRLQSLKIFNRIAPYLSSDDLSYALKKLKDPTIDNAWYFNWSDVKKILSYLLPKASEEQFSVFFAEVIDGVNPVSDRMRDIAHLFLPRSNKDQMEKIFKKLFVNKLKENIKVENMREILEDLAFFQRLQDEQKIHFNTLISKIDFKKMPFLSHLKKEDNPLQQFIIYLLQNIEFKYNSAITLLLFLKFHPYLTNGQINTFLMAIDEACAKEFTPLHFTLVEILPRLAEILPRISDKQIYDLFNTISNCLSFKNLSSWRRKAWFFLDKLASKLTQDQIKDLLNSIRERLKDNLSDDAALLAIKPLDNYFSEEQMAELLDLIIIKLLGGQKIDNVFEFLAKLSPLRSKRHYDQIMEVALRLFKDTTSPKSIIKFLKTNAHHLSQPEVDQIFAQVLKLATDDESAAIDLLITLITLEKLSKLQMQLLASANIPLVQLALHVI